MFRTLGIPIVPRGAWFSGSGVYLKSLSYLYLYMFGKSFFSVIPPFPFSQRFPDINALPFPNLFTVKRQLFSHFPQRTCVVLISNLSISSDFSRVDVYSMSILASYCSFESNATPYAPISPEMFGLITFFPTIFSKLRKTASL